MILVVGATGLVGSEVCQRLMRRGEPVRALVRATSSKEKIEVLRSLGVELCVGDLKDPQSIVAACRGVNAVISTASSTLTRQPGDSIESVDAAGQLNLVNAAKDANVGRFRFVSQATRHIVPPGRCEGAGRECCHESELYCHSSELVYGSVAEPGPGIRLCERGGPNLRTGNEPDQLGFFPRRRRNLRGRASTSGGRAENDRVWRTRGAQPP
jgi:NmrA-like family